MIEVGKLRAFSVGVGGRNHYRIAAEEVQRVEECRAPSPISPQAPDRDATAAAGAPSGETQPTIPAALLRRRKSERNRSARPGSRNSGPRLVVSNRDDP